MDPVRAVLENNELTSMICDAIQDVSVPDDDELDDYTRSSSPLSTQCRRELLKFALVCRGICEVTLGLLWKEISYEITYRNLFPREIMSSYEEKLFDRPPITIRHWSRFDFYARMVRAISIPDVMYFLEPLPRHPHRHYHFPYITSLNLDNGSQMLSFASAFLCPTLIQISFKTSGDQDDNAIADTMQAVAETCPLLRKFSYSHSRWVPWSFAVEDSLVSMVLHCVHLQEVSIPASRMIVDALGRLSCLSKLALCDYFDENLPFKKNRLSKKHDCLDQKPFSALESLATLGRFSSTFLTELLRDAGCFPRTQISIDDSGIHSYPNPLSGLELAETIRLVMRQDFSCGLQKIHVCRSALTSPVAHPVPEDSWQPFRCLLTLSHLRNFDVHGFSLDIHNSDLEEMTQNWRELQSLRISPVPATSEFKSNITFQGLTHLSTLPELRDLSVPIGPDSRILPSLISKPTSSISPLTTIEILGKFPLVTNVQLTLFLVKYFPNLKEVSVSGRKLGPHPNEIETGLEFARQTLHAMHDSGSSI